MQIRALQMRNIIILLSTMMVSGLALANITPASGEGLRLVSKKQKAKPALGKIAKVRDDLHRNLDGKGDGFIRGWSFDSHTFTLTVDKTRYRQNAVLAATMAARSIFDLNGVPLPIRLVIRDRSGEILGGGPFANVPKLID